MEEIKTKEENDVVLFDKINVYTDGSSIPNPGPGGYGIMIQYVCEGKTVKEEFFGGMETHTTNNRMELTGVVGALRKLKGSKSLITVTVDSKYCKDGITSFIKNWKKNGWNTSNRTPVKNKDLWVALDEATTGLHLVWLWTKSHSTHRENNIVDKIAKTHAKKALDLKKRSNTSFKNKY